MISAWILISLDSPIAAFGCVKDLDDASCAGLGLMPDQQRIKLETMAWRCSAVEITECLHDEAAAVCS